jgi:hypothetical protein
MIDDAGLTDEQWVDYWLKRQRERLSLIEQCKAAGSLRPFASFLFDRAKAVYELAKARYDAAIAKREWATTAYEYGRLVANRQVMTVAAQVAKAEAVAADAAETTLDTARELGLRDVVRAARLLAKERAEPTYSRTNPEPGIPPWYYPEESTDDR